MELNDLISWVSAVHVLYLIWVYWTLPSNAPQKNPENPSSKCLLY